MQDELLIIDLYNNADGDKITKFNSSIKSDYTISSNYEKVEADFAWLDIMEDTIKYLDNLDGDKYYFKNYGDEYYEGLFDSKDYKEIVKKYNKGLPLKKDKEFILKIIEKICKENKIDRFKVYNLPYLITRLKYKMAGKNKDYYYDFIKKIKVEF